MKNIADRRTIGLLLIISLCIGADIGFTQAALPNINPANINPIYMRSDNRESNHLEEKTDIANDQNIEQTTPTEQYCDLPNQPNVTSTEHFQINYGNIPAPLTIGDFEQILEAVYQNHITTYGWAEPPLCAEDLQNLETDLTGLTCFTANPWGKYPVVIADIGESSYGYVSSGDDSADWNPNRFLPWRGFAPLSMAADHIAMI